MKLFKGIDYRILRRSKQKSTVLCKIYERETLLKNAQNGGYQRKDHPISSDKRYTFGYGMDRFDVFCKGKEVYEIVFQIPCFSLTEYYLVPLDKYIQKRAWEEYRLQDGEIWVCEDIEMIYRIANSIYEEKFFSPENRKWISEHSVILKGDIFNWMVKKVFFGFKDSLIEKIETGDFDNLYLDYLKYSDY